MKQQPKQTNESNTIDSSMQEMIRVGDLQLCSSRLDIVQLSSLAVSILTNKDVKSYLELNKIKKLSMPGVG